MQHADTNSMAVRSESFRVDEAHCSNPPQEDGFQQHKGSKQHMKQMQQGLFDDARRAIFGFQEWQVFWQGAYKRYSRFTCAMSCAVRAEGDMAHQKLLIINLYTMEIHPAGDSRGQAAGKQGQGRRGRSWGKGVGSGT